MTTLSKDTPRQYVPFVTDVEAYPMIAADIVYEGAAVGDDGNGYSRPLVAGDPFRGFAEQKADNSTGAAGAINVSCRTKGYIKLSVTGVVITSVGLPVYASDDATFTLTVGTNTLIGVVHRYISAGVAIVEFATVRPPATVGTSDLSADAVTNAKIADDAVSAEHLDDGVLPSHVVKFAGEAAWSGSGASLAATVAGVLATDIVVASILTAPTESGYLVSAVASADTITFTLSAANTTNDAVISYAVLRAVA